MEAEIYTLVGVVQKETAKQVYHQISLRKKKQSNITAKMNINYTGWK